MIPKCPIHRVFLQKKIQKKIPRGLRFMIVDFEYHLGEDEKFLYYLCPKCGKIEGSLPIKEGTKNV